MYCGKCGSRIDEATGLCPHCESEQLAAAQAQVMRKKSNKAIPIIIVVTVVLIALIGGITCYFLFWKNRDDNGFGKVNEVASERYTQYLSDNLASDIGFLSTNYESTSPQGIISAREIDFEKDGKNEFFTFYAKKNDKGGTDYRLAALSYHSGESDDNNNNNNNNTQTPTKKPSNQADNGQQTDEKSDALPAEDDSVQAADEETVITVPEDQSAIGFEMVAYTVEHENRQYIFVERVNYAQGYDYFCRVYTMENEKLTEVANIIEPLLGSDGTEMIYSTKLWSGKEIDDSDFENSEYSGEAYGGDDTAVLYYKAGGGENYVFDTYYVSKKEAVSDFFKAFGLERKDYVRYNEEEPGRVLLAFDGEEGVIFRYSHYPFGDEDSYEFKDYTDINTTLQTKPKQEDTAEVDLRETIQQASSFMSDFYSERSYDYDDRITVSDDNYNEDKQLICYTADDVQTWDQLREKFENYYTSDAFDTKFKVQHQEQDGKLYLDTGIVDSISPDYVFVYQKTAEDEYTFKQYAYKPVGMSAGSEPDEDEFHLVHQNGKWVFDTILSFDIVDFALVNQEDAKEYARFKQFDAYYGILVQTQSNYSDASFNHYLYFDIDKDGTGELIIDTGSYKGDREFAYYGFDGEDSYLITRDNVGLAELRVKNDGTLFACLSMREQIRMWTVALKDGAIEWESFLEEDYSSERWEELEEEYPLADMKETVDSNTLLKAVFDL